MHSDSLAQTRTDKGFARIQKLIYKHTAIVLSDEKQDFVRSRIAKRMRVLGVDSINDYCDCVEEGRESLTTFTNQVTTNHTHFFREQHHFQTLAAHLQQIGLHNRTIWSSACSSGEEPYSIAITLAESFPDFFQSNVKIIASDIDETILNKAKEGIYNADRVSSMSAQRKQFSLVKGKGDYAGSIRIKKPLREMIDFRQVNLVEPFAFTSRMDVIFCRNVVIYFDNKTKIDLFNRFADLQEPGDLLFIGHSESLNNLSKAYTCKGGTTYERL